MNLISEIYYSCEMREYVFIVLWEYGLITSMVGLILVKVELILIHMATWVFGLVVILLFKKDPPLYKGMSLNFGIFKILVCVSLD